MFRHPSRAASIAGGLLAVAALVPGAGAAHAAPAAPALASAPTTYEDGAVDLPIKPRAQEQSNWCWAATGSTIAEYRGKNVTQNVFCNLANGRATTSACPNEQATLANDQQAFRALGIKPGRYVADYLDLDAVAAEINQDRPVLTRIQWSSGGGHMMVLSGYDATAKTVEWYDPWPDDRRINVGDYDYYVDGPDFTWTHTLYGIGAL